MWGIVCCVGLDMFLVCVSEDVSGGGGQGALVLKLRGGGQRRHQQEQSRSFNRRRN